MALPLPGLSTPSIKYHKLSCFNHFATKISPFVHLVIASKIWINAWTCILISQKIRHSVTTIRLCLVSVFLPLNHSQFTDEHSVFLTLPLQLNHRQMDMWSQFSKQLCQTSVSPKWIAIRILRNTIGSHRMIIHVIHHQLQGNYNFSPSLYISAQICALLQFIFWTIPLQLIRVYFFCVAISRLCAWNS